MPPSRSPIDFSARCDPTLRATVVIDCMDGRLPPSDRAAATLAATRFGESAAFCPSGAESALRYALAAGCTRVSRELERDNADVYLVGSGGAQDEGDLMAARLAAAKGAELVLNVLDAQSLDGELRVERDLARGAREVLYFSGPAVLMLSDEAPRPRYVSHHRQRMARLPPAAQQPETEQSARGAGATWGPVRPRTKTAELGAKTSGDARSRMFAAFGINQQSTDSKSVIEGDADTCAAHLVRYLAHHQIIERTTHQDLGLTSSSPAASTAPVERKSDATTSVTRGPRSLERPTTGAARRPRRYQPSPGRAGNLARAPRPLDGSRLANCRGPYPIETRRKPM